MYPNVPEVSVHSAVAANNIDRRDALPPLRPGELRPPPPSSPPLPPQDPLGNDSPPLPPVTNGPPDDDVREILVEPLRMKDSDSIVSNYGTYINSVEERLAFLEDKLRSLGGRESPGTVIEIVKRRKAIPKQRRVLWTDFKNEFEEDHHCAIDVLEGPARYWYNLKDDESRRKRFSSRKEAAPIDSGKTTSAAQLKGAYPPGMPERIRINSLPILHILAEIIPNLSKRASPPVMLRPYKALVHYEKEIREVFEELKEKWADIDVQGEAEDEFDDAPRRIGPEERTEVPRDLSDTLEAFRDMRCLVEFIDQDIRPTIDYYASGSATKIRFHDLFFLFPPGELVYEPIKQKTEQKTVRTGQAESGGRADEAQRTQTIYRTVRTANGRPYLSGGPNINPPTTIKDKYDYFGLCSYYLDFQGSDFGPLVKITTIAPFEGEIDITSLDMYPLKYAPDKARIQEGLVENGKKYRSLTGVRHMEYNGPTYSRDFLGNLVIVGRGYDPPKQHENIQARVVIDVKTSYLQTQWHLYRRQIPPDITEGPRQMREDYPRLLWKDREMREMEGKLDDEIFNDDFVDREMRASYIHKDPFLSKWLEDDESKKFGAEDLTDDLLMLLPNLLPGYVLRNREFVMLNIDYLREIRPDLDGFDNLQLREGQKEMVQALVNTHFRDKATDLAQQLRGRKDDEYIPDVDIVEGKGKGLVILLHGAPGVGKTSTAECVAESSRKPLLPIICGDLGITAADVERSLEQKFELAEKWNCVLLLDEADVFLAQRTKTDLKRNALVSVFLRILEYYTGILFLTTNRVGAFDEAFRSRIHMTLYYPLLDEDQTKRIWTMNLRRILKRKEGKLEASEDELLNFAIDHFRHNQAGKTRWNGRQIRNAFQTAAALAEFEAHSNRKKEASETPSTETPVIAKLQVKHFKLVADAALQFDNYIEETIDFDQSDRAWQARERADHFNWKRRSNNRQNPASVTPFGAGSEYEPHPPYYAPRQDQPLSNYTPSRERSYTHERDPDGYDRRTPGSGLSERMQDSAINLATPGGNRWSPGPPPSGGYDRRSPLPQGQRGPYASAPFDEPPFSTHQRAGYELGRGQYQRGEHEPPVQHGDPYGSNLPEPRRY